MSGYIRDSLQGVVGPSVPRGCRQKPLSFPGYPSTLGGVVFFAAQIIKLVKM